MRRQIKHDEAFVIDAGEVLATLKEENQKLQRQLKYANKEKDECKTKLDAIGRIATGDVNFESNWTSL